MKIKSFFWGILVSIVACGLLLSLYFYFSNGTARTHLPVYEEVYSTTADLRDGIREIDYAIYESVYRNGPRKTDVFFLDVQPRHQNGYAWDFTELLVKCPDADSAAGFQESIARELAALRREIRVRKEKISDSRSILHVFAKGFHTHKITLTFDYHEPSVGDARPRIAIIIDDLGYDSDMAFSFIRLDLPLSFSILPCAPFTDLVAQEANRAGCEILLHLPMEPKKYPSINPGPGAVFLSMDEHEIRQILDKDLKEIPGVCGVNNHMGSSFTEDREKMLVVLKELKKRRLFYIDSRTTRGTVGLKLARDIGLPAARRNVFLDNDLTPKAIRLQMERLLNMARHSGSAIGIGHPHIETLKVLEEYSPKIKAEFQIVPVSELVS